MNSQGQANTAYKSCPKCSQPAILSMTACQRCGYQFSNAPVVSALPVEPFASPTVSTLTTTNWLLVGIIFMLGIVAWFIYLHDRHTVDNSRPFLPVSSISRSKSPISETAFANG
jgi:hypothetical protein